jgi:hypothetical protein
MPVGGPPGHGYSLRGSACVQEPEDRCSLRGHPRLRERFGCCKMPCLVYTALDQAFPRVPLTKSQQEKEDEQAYV